VSQNKKKNEYNLWTMPARERRAALKKISVSDEQIRAVLSVKKKEKKSGSNAVASNALKFSSSTISPIFGNSRKVLAR